jgi:hypothetical protein
VGSVMYGIYIGKDASVAVTDEFIVAFLRVREENIVSLLRHNECGILGIVSGSEKISTLIPSTVSIMLTTVQSISTMKKRLNCFKNIRMILVCLMIIN